MTRGEALATVYRLAAGLGPDLAACGRLLERVAAHDEGEALRAALIELGAERVLDDAESQATDGRAS